MERNILPIHPQTPVFYITCVACGKSARSVESFADPAGEPFKDYYCGPCGRQALEVR